MRRNPLIRALCAVVIGAAVLGALCSMAAIYIDSKKADDGSRYYVGSSSRGTSTVIANSDDSLDEYSKLENDGTYKVVSVIDGDTIKVQYGDEIKSVRLIGINAPEISGEKQCYGTEATEYLRSKIEGKEVVLTTDGTQDNLDKYSRLLRYVFLGDKDLGVDLISNGYAKEYTYNEYYSFRDLYISAQDSAKNSKLGLWGDKCTASKDAGQKNDNNTASNSANCNIKGNISYYDGTKIYHVPGQKYYESTQIDESAGERWFCSEAEAQAAGWRKSKE